MIQNNSFKIALKNYKKASYFIIERKFHSVLDGFEKFKKAKKVIRKLNVPGYAVFSREYVEFLSNKKLLPK